MNIQSLSDSISSDGALLQNILNVLIFIARFLFLTPWGWILIAVGFASMLAVRVKNKKGEYNFSSVVGGTTETLVWFFANISSVLIGLFLILLLSGVYMIFNETAGALRLFQRVKNLEAALKNMHSERKLLEVKATPVEMNGTNRINLSLTYYVWSPESERDIPSGNKLVSIEGKKAYFDFGVLNFRYSLVENGDKINIAFPYRVYSDSVPPAEGTPILAGKGPVPYSFEIPTNEIYGLTAPDYYREVRTLISASTNKTQARLLGLRSLYSEAVTVTPSRKYSYAFYSTAAGGVILKRE